MWDVLCLSVGLECGVSEDKLKGSVGLGQIDVE